MIKTVLLDFDGTLIDMRPLWINPLIMAFKKFNKKLNYKIYEELALIVPKRPLHYFLMKNIFIIGRKRKLSIFNSIKLVIYTGIYQLKSKKSIIVLPGVIKFLEILRKKEIKVAIVTSSRRKNVDRFLSNIRRNDILCISRDDTRNWKPHPDSIYKAFEMINSNGDSAIYLGDFPIDIIAGKKANIMTGGIFGNKPVGFKKQLEKYKPDILVSNVLKAIRYILETN